MKGAGISNAAWALALWMLGALPSHAGDKDEWRVTLDIQMVTISPDSALKLVPRLRETATFDQAFAEIQRMIGRDEADLIAWPVVVAPRLPDFQTGENKVTSESIIEERCPAQFLPPQTPTTIGAPGSLARLFHLRPGDVTASPSFETRDVGVTITAGAAVFHGGDMVALSVRPARTILLEYQTIRSPISPAGIIGGFPNPQFQTAQVDTHLTVRNGRRMLLGTFVESKPEAKVLLFLLKAIATRTGGKTLQP